MLIGTTCTCIKGFKVKINNETKLIKKGTVFIIKNWFLIEDNIYIEFNELDSSYDIELYYDFFEWTATLDEILKWKPVK